MEVNLTRLRGLVEMRGFYQDYWECEARRELPCTIVAVTPPPTIPTKTDIYTFSRLIDACDFVVRFDDGTLPDGRNTRTVSGFSVLPDPKALAQLLAASRLN